MAKRRSTTAVSLFERLLGTEPGIKVNLDTVSLSDDLLTGLQRMRPTALMAQFPSLTHAQAEQLKARLDVTTAAMMRAFREKRLSDGGRRSADELKGPLAQSTGPTFENQFRPTWGNNADPQAVGASVSPAAYLIDLLLFVEQHLEPEAVADRALTLRDRRPDVFRLMLDAQTMNQEVTQVEVVVQALQQLIETQRQQTPQDVTQVEDRLLEVRYPPRLFPYEAYWQQIRTVLAHNKVHLSEVSRLSDIQAPYFIRPGAHSSRSDDALQQDAAMGPLLRKLLLEPPYFEEGKAIQLTRLTAELQALTTRGEGQAGLSDAEAEADFFRRNFGVQGYPDLQNVVNFCQALQVDQAGMQRLFALAEHTPLRSANVPEATVKWASASLAGARFINSGGTDPVAVGNQGGDEKQHEFLFLTAARCDRVNRLVRVANALGLEYADADRLLCAAIDGETHTVIERSRGRLSNAERPMVITSDTLRSLGLFQFLRERFALADTPERLARFTDDFSVLLADMSIYGTSKVPSQFDQVFNSNSPNVLWLDQEPLSLTDDDEKSKRFIDLLCSGLGINRETFRPLARVIMQAQGSLTRSLPVVSAFYRLVWLARLLAITPVELLSLLEVFNPEGLYALRLAGKPQVATYRSDTTQTDVINVVHALATSVLWCREQEIPIVWLVRQLLPHERSDVASMDVRTLLTELASKLQPFRAFNALLEEAGVTPLNRGNWQSYLLQVVDGDGLITDSGDPEEDFDPVLYEDFARREIQAVIEQLQPQEPDRTAVSAVRSAEEPELPVLTDDEAERLTSLILGVVLRVRAQQWGAVQEQLAQLLELESSMVIPVIYWAESNVHKWMESAIGFDPQQLDSVQLKAILPLERQMQRRAEVVRQFALSPALFSSLLVRTQRQRFSIQTPELTLPTLYYLERYTRLLRTARQSEAQLLGYFSLVEALGEMSDNERRLVKDAAAEKVANLLGCGIREVLDVARLVSVDGIIRNLAQFCALLDTRELCKKTGLSAVSLMKLSQLGPGSDTSAYRATAEEMLSSLRHTVDAPRDDEELRQSLSTRCTASSLRLIAKSAEEDLYEEHEKRSILTLTLLDMDNQPVPGIRVNWSTDQGDLLDRFSYTDEQGRATVTLQAGDAQGVANVKASYLLDSEAYAPPVVIDCDDLTLGLWAIGSRPEEPWLPAGNQGTYTLKFQLRDVLGNLGGDRLVSYSTSIGYLVDSDGNSTTDRDGISTMRVRSMEAGEGRVLVWFGTLDPIVRNIGFANRPFIRALNLTSAAVAGQPISVTAWVFGLDGQPAANQPLLWECEGAKLDQADAQSDEKGMARATFKDAVAGLMQVTALLTADGQDYVSKVLEFKVLADADQYVTGQSWDWPVADGVMAAEFEVKICSSEGEPVARYPVTWNVLEDDTLSQVVVTGEEGVSRFALKSKEPKTFNVVASWAGNTHPFEAVQFMPALAVDIEFDGKPVAEIIEIVQPSSGKTQHTLTYHLEDHPLLNMPVYLRYYGRPSAYPQGLSVEPALGVEQRFVDGKVQWTVNCEFTGLTQPGNGEFRLMYEHAVDGILTRVKVHPPR
ncbi:Ig-like domain-containing protein [Pseudomonas sp. HS6-2]|uniref:Ig-like domain-containing protein n=1 Tax=Pseudomonas sp. HS6-2 TaxID=3410986 RepID=UPI003BBC5870